MHNAKCLMHNYWNISISIIYSILSIIYIDLYAVRAQNCVLLVWGALRFALTSD